MSGPFVSADLPLLSPFWVFVFAPKRSDYTYYQFAYFYACFLHQTRKISIPIEWQLVLGCVQELLNTLSLCCDWSGTASGGSCPQRFFLPKYSMTSSCCAGGIIILRIQLLHSFSSPPLKAVNHVFSLWGGLCDGLTAFTPALSYHSYVATTCSTTFMCALGAIFRPSGHAGVDLKHIEIP